MVNCTITYNDAVFSRGGGMYCVDSYPFILNCTFSKNTASVIGFNPGSGIYCLNSEAEIVNSILWGDAISEIDSSGPDALVSYSDIQGGYSGVENIDEDPLYKDSENHDFHLSYGSPCIDKGTNNDPDLPDFDFENDPRILDGNNDGSQIVDMGADEYVNFCECDLNTDGSCNVFDWFMFIEDWGRTDCAGDCECDLNGDGSCNVFDWFLFIEDWGRTDCPV